MKIVYSSIIPLPGYKLFNFLGLILFARKGSIITKRDLQHELIHTAQYREMLYIGFLLWYLIEWIVKSIKYWSFHKGYRNIGFELEAYEHQQTEGYLSNRKRYAWFDYM